MRNPHLHSLWSAPALAISLVIKARPFSLGQPYSRAPSIIAPPKKRTTSTTFSPSTTRSPSPSRPSIQGDAVFSVIVGVCETRSADRETDSEALDQGFSKTCDTLKPAFSPDDSNSSASQQLSRILRHPFHRVYGTYDSCLTPHGCPSHHPTVHAHIVIVEARDIRSRSLQEPTYIKTITTCRSITSLS